MNRETQAMRDLVYYWIASDFARSLRKLYRTNQEPFEYGRLMTARKYLRKAIPVLPRRFQLEIGARIAKEVRESRTMQVAA